MADIILEKLGLEARQPADLSAWRRVIEAAKQPKPKISIALVGKYVELHDAYMSVREALKHAGLNLGVDVDIRWVLSTELERGKGWELLEGVDGILVPGGFGSRGIEGKIQAVRYARTHKIPFFGLCLGMQLMVVEFGRHIFNSEQVNSTEFDRSTPYPVIDLMPDQQHITDMGGTMRLGLYPCILQPGTIAAQAYGTDRIDERHRHRFEFNNVYREQYEQAGMRFSGLSPDGKLVEIVELADHPFMLATQFHPEFLSRPERPHPLFTAFLKAVTAHAGMETQAAAPGEPAA